MKRYVIHSLLALIGLLAMALAAMWFHRDGGIRNVRWQPPKAQSQNFASMVPELPFRGQVDTSRFLAVLERPLFSPARRPPPPPPSKALEVQDPLPNVHLYGLYGGAGGGGAIVRVDGKSQRVRLNEPINGWTLSAIGERNIILRRGSRSHSVELVNVMPNRSGNVPSSPPLSAPAPQNSFNGAQQLR